MNEVSKIIKQQLNESIKSYNIIGKLLKMARNKSLKTYDRISVAICTGEPYKYDFNRYSDNIMFREGEFYESRPESNAIKVLTDDCFEGEILRGKSARDFMSFIRDEGRYRKYSREQIDSYYKSGFVAVCNRYDYNPWPPRSAYDFYAVIKLNEIGAKKFLDARKRYNCNTPLDTDEFVESIIN